VAEENHPLLRVVISAPLVRVKSSRCSGDIRHLAGDIASFVGGEK
jgi:hypothetical protein